MECCCCCCVLWCVLRASTELGARTELHSSSLPPSLMSTVLSYLRVMGLAPLWCQGVAHADPSISQHPYNTVLCSSYSVPCRAVPTRSEPLVRMREKHSAQARVRMRMRTAARRRALNIGSLPFALSVFCSGAFRRCLMQSEHFPEPNYRALCCCGNTLHFCLGGPRLIPLLRHQLS